MKYIISLAFLLFLSTGFSQYGLRPLYFQPIRQLGDKYKSTGSLEASFTEFFTETNLRGSYAFNALWLRPVQDSMRIYEYDNYTVVPGVEKTGTYFLFNSCIGLDWAPFELGKFYPYTGFDFTISLSHTNYSRQVEGQFVEDDSGFGIAAGYRVKLGLEYQYSDEMAFFLQLNRLGWYDLETDYTGGGIDAGLGIRLAF